MRLQEAWRAEAGGSGAGAGRAVAASGGSATGRLPRWLKRPLPAGDGGALTRKTLAALQLQTVCVHARCPNRPECYAHRVATFMILGSVCTRSCRFCAVRGGRPSRPQPDEPRRVAEAAAQLRLRHVVITSPTRDDLPDGGAEWFYRTVVAVRERTGARVEVLTPDFGGRRWAVARVLDAAPAVYNHNLETVPRLYRRVRPRAVYGRSLDLLRFVKRQQPGIRTKSGIMVGLGETVDEVLELLSDLRAVDCDLVTVGQYLCPGPGHLPVQRYWRPAEFDRLGRLARRLGFRRVACGPFVRSSYRADELIEPP